MKIGILTNLIDENSDGIGVYSYNLVKNLNYIDKKNEYYLIHYLRKDLDIYNSNNELIIPSYPLNNSIFWKYGVLPIKLKKCGMDIVHDPFEIGPLSFQMPFKKIITIHDVMPILFPDLFDTIGLILHKLLFKKTVKNVNKIITDSYSSRKDIMRYLNVPEENIEVIYLAADERFKQLCQNEMIKIRKKYNLDFQFILSVGGIHPIKNISNIIKAYYKLKKEGFDHKLVIVGRKITRSNNLFEMVKKLKLENDVIFLGRVSFDDLIKLYNAADLFVYPCLYAGFGLPPLESMACGTPVITSNIASIPEVVGNAAIMIDPYDVNELAEAIKIVLMDDDLKTDLIKRGLERTKLFNWRKTAEETLKVYEKVHDEI